MKTMPPLRSRSLTWAAVFLLGTIFTRDTESFVIRKQQRLPQCGISECKYRLLSYHRRATRRNSDADDEISVPTVKRTRRPPRIRKSATSNDYNDDQKKKKKNSAVKDGPSQTVSNGDNDAKFSSRSDIHPLTQRALDEVLHLTEMTPIQVASYSAVLEGKNVLAQSKTGSGKTLAYLIPSLQRVLNGDVPWHGRSVALVILSPTRELAIQIADQAEALLTFHNTRSSLLFAGGTGSSKGDSNNAVACLYGGVKMSRDRRLLAGRNGLPAVVISTPGRLLQHLEDTRLDDGRKFSDVVDETQMVVLDETDRLLEAFPHETKRILSYLSRAEKRQNLLFSATFPRRLRETLMAGETAIVKGDVVEISCSEKVTIKDEKNDRQHSGINNKAHDDKSSSNSRQPSIEQSYVIMDDIESQYLELLLAILRREISNLPDEYKIIVFFPTGRLVRFMYQLFSSPGLKMENVWEIHSRMSQASRNRSSEAFRKARKGILLSSDVSQRGLDYPDVSVVVQYGAPRSRNDYIHRLGRTGRAGKSGKGVLVLMPFEQEKRPRKGIQLDKEAASWLQQDNSEDEQTTITLALCRQDLDSLRWKVRSQHGTLAPNAASAVTSFLAHYLPRGRRQGGDTKRNSSTLDGRKALEYAQHFASALGLSEVPELDPRLNDRIES